MKPASSCHSHGKWTTAKPHCNGIYLAGVSVEMSLTHTRCADRTPKSVTGSMKVHSAVHHAEGSNTMRRSWFSIRTSMQREDSNCSARIELTEEWGVRWKRRRRYNEILGREPLLLQRVGKNYTPVSYWRMRVLKKRVETIPIQHLYIVIDFEPARDRKTQNMHSPISLRKDSTPPRHVLQARRSAQGKRQELPARPASSDMK